MLIIYMGVVDIIETITNMKPEDIEKLTSKEKEMFDNFKQQIELHNQTLQQLRSAKSNLEHEIYQKKSYLNTSKQNIPMKVYFKEIGFVLLVGILSSFVIINNGQTQSNIQTLILLLNSLIILCASLFPLIILQKI